MATKKCPKCGEENPAEAVMCWACYTPLAGGAAAVAGGGLVTPRGGAASVAPVASAEDTEKSPIDPKIFLVAGLLLLALIIGGFTSGIFSGSSSASTGGVIIPDAPSGSVPRSGGGGSPVQPQQPNVAPPAITSNPGGGPTGPPPEPAPFKTIVAPDPRYANATMAIVPNQSNTNPAQAKGLAKFAKQMFAPGGKWTGMQVLVFSNLDAAKDFAKYQAPRRGANLTPEDYRELAGRGVWSNVLAFYESKGNSEAVYQPSSSPNNWWTGGGGR